MPAQKRLWIVVTLVAALLIPEAVSASSQPTLTGEGYIRFTDYGLVLSYEGETEGVLTVSTGTQDYVLDLSEASDQVGTASATSRRTLIKKKFFSKSYLKSHGYLKRKPNGSCKTKCPRRSSGTSSVMAAADDPDCFWDCVNVRNIQPDGRPWWYIKGSAVEGGPGPTTISITLNHSIANGYSTKLGLTAQFVSAEFGFNVQYTDGISFTNTTQVEKGICKRVAAHAVYQDYKGEVWRHAPFGSWAKIGWVRTWEFDGIGFKVYKQDCPR